MLSQIRERVARRRAEESVALAANECSQHIERGICVFMDQYVAALETEIRSAFRDHTRRLSPEQTIAWSQVRFCTEKDRVIIARGPALQSQPTCDLGDKPLVVAFPRAQPNMLAGLISLLMRKEGDADLMKPVFLANGSARPSIEWGSQFVVHSIEMRDRTRRRTGRE
jgi:hypothetical protein